MCVHRLLKSAPSTSIARIKFYDIAGVGLNESGERKKKTISNFEIIWVKECNMIIECRKRISINFFFRSFFVSFSLKITIIISEYSIQIAVVNRSIVCQRPYSFQLIKVLLPPSLAHTHLALHEDRKWPSSCYKVFVIKIGACFAVAKVKGNGQWEMYLRHSTEK